MQTNGCVKRTMFHMLGLSLIAALSFSWGCGDDDDDGNGAGTGGTGGAGGTSGAGGTGGAGGTSGTGGTGGSMADAGGTGGMGGTGGTGIDAAVDEDSGAEDAAVGSFRDVSLDMMGMGPHVDQRMEFRIVSASDELVARGILESLPSPNETFSLPSSTPDGQHRLDFTADLNGNGAYDAPPTDHAWTLPIAASGDAMLDFTHNTTFDDIDDPAITEALDFTLSATGMTPHLGQRMELRVIDMATGQLVGIYVLSEIPDADFDLTIPGVVEQGRSYQVDFYADLSGNETYDAPPTDHAWREMGTADASGLTIDFAHNTTFTDVGF